MSEIINSEKERRKDERFYLNERIYLDTKIQLTAHISYQKEIIEKNIKVLNLSTTGIKFQSNDNNVMNINDEVVLEIFLNDLFLTENPGIKNPIVLIAEIIWIFNLRRGLSNFGCRISNKHDLDYDLFRELVAFLKILKLEGKNSDVVGI